jgi:arylsulfate sulfotransferase
VGQVRSVRVGFGFAVIVLLAVLTTGCGVSSAPIGKDPRTAVSSTAHPLVALYQVSVPAAANVWAEFGTTTAYGRQTSGISTPQVKTLTGAPDALFLSSILVAGMKASTTYHMRAHVDWANGTTWVDTDHTFTTGSLPDHKALNVTITRPAGAATVRQHGVELLNMVNTGAGSSTIQAPVFDLDGNLIWYYDSPNQTAVPVKPLANGHFLAVVGNPIPGDVGDEYFLREVDLTGKTIREVNSTQLDQMLQALGFPLKIAQLHHDILPLPNGHVIVLANGTAPYNNLVGHPGQTQVVGDFLIDLDQTWTPVWLWSTFDHLDINRALFGYPDWTHANALVYTPNDGNLLLSLRNQSWIIKIEYANGTGAGKVLWRLGNQGDFSLAGGDSGQWFYAQHYPNLLSINGSQLTMAVFDNGNNRILSDGTACGFNPQCFSRGTIFTFDEVARTANLDWDDQPGPGLFSIWGGSIDVADNGAVEFDLCAPFGAASQSRIMEVTQDASNTLIWQMDVTGENAYRAYRIPSLYPGVSW